MIGKNLGFSPTSGLLIKKNKESYLLFKLAELELLFLAAKNSQLIHRRGSGQMRRGEFQKGLQQPQKVEKAAPCHDLLMSAREGPAHDLNVSSRPSKAGYLSMKKPN